MGRKKDPVDDMLGFFVLGVLLFLSIFFVSARLMNQARTETGLVIKYWYVWGTGVVSIVLFLYIRTQRKKK